MRSGKPLANIRQRRARVEAVLFDMDGVLVDTIKIWYAVVRKTMRELGFRPISWRRFRSDFGQGTMADSELYLNGTIRPEMLERFYVKYMFEFFDRVRPHRGAAFLLDDLKRAGKKIACVTNSNKSIAVKTLRKCGLFDKIDFLIAGDEVKNHKPHPDMVVRALRRFKIPASGAVMVGDSAVDLGAARAAGVSFIAFSRPIAGADIVVRRLNRLAGLLGLGSTSQSGLNGKTKK